MQTIDYRSAFGSLMAVLTFQAGARWIGRRPSWISRATGNLGSVVRAFKGRPDTRLTALGIVINRRFGAGRTAASLHQTQRGIGQDYHPRSHITRWVLVLCFVGVWIGFIFS